MSEGESLLITSSFHVEPSKRDEFFRQAQELKSKSQQEDGCLTFELFEDPMSANRFFFYHQWRDREALNQHTQTPHLQQFISVFPGLLVGQPHLLIHRLAESKPADLSAFGATGKNA